MEWLSLRIDGFKKTSNLFESKMVQGFLAWTNQKSVESNKILFLEQDLVRGVGDPRDPVEVVPTIKGCS